MWLPLVAAAAALVVCLYGVNVWQARVAERGVRCLVSSVEGDANRVQGSGFRVGDGSTAGTQLSVGDIINVGEEVRVGAAGNVKLAYADGSVIELQKSTTLALAAGDRRQAIGAKAWIGWAQRHAAKQIRLESGQLFANVAKQPTGQPMVLSTPQARVTVVGTKFSLLVTENATDAASSLTRLNVQEGVVRIERLVDSKTANVSAGEIAIAGQNGLEFEKQAAGKTAKENVGALDDEYVDGKILFADDFKDGLKNWQKVVLGEGSEFVRFDDPHEWIRVVDGKHMGPVRVLVICKNDAKRRQVGVRLGITETPITAAAFSVNFDWYLTAPVEEFCPLSMEFLDKTNKQLVRFGRDKNSGLQGQWCHVRIECIRSKGQAGNDRTHVESYFENGKWLSSSGRQGNLLNILITQSREGEARFGNVVIRELVPHNVAGNSKH
jgi:hypothetical protein